MPDHRSSSEHPDILAAFLASLPPLPPAGGIRIFPDPAPPIGDPSAFRAVRVTLPTPDPRGTFFVRLPRGPRFPRASDWGRAAVRRIVPACTPIMWEPYPDAPTRAGYARVYWGNARLVFFCRTMPRCLDRHPVVSERDALARLGFPC